MDTECAEHSYCSVSAGYLTRMDTWSRREVTRPGISKHRRFGRVFSKSLLPDPLFPSCANMLGRFEQPRPCCRPMFSCPILSLSSMNGKIVKSLGLNCGI